MRIGDSWKCGVTIPKLLNQFVIKSANSKQGDLRSFVRIAFFDFPNPFGEIGFDRDHAIARNYLDEAGMSQSRIQMGGRLQALWRQSRLNQSFFNSAKQRGSRR